MRLLLPNRPERRLLVAVLLLAIPGCSDDPTGGGSGNPAEMIATVISPNGDEGSAVLELGSGGRLVDVSAVEPDTRAYLVPTSPPRVVALRLRPGEITFRLVAADSENPPTLEVVEVGAPDDRLRPDVSDYSVVVTPEAGS